MEGGGRREGGREGWPAVLRRSEEGVRMEVRGGRKERGLLARLLQLTPHPPLWVLRGVLLPPLSCAPGGPARRGLNQTLMRRRPPYQARNCRHFLASLEGLAECGLTQLSWDLALPGCCQARTCHHFHAHLGFQRSSVVRGPK